MNFATDCKQTVFQLTAIASCEVAGVAYGPGDTIHTATKRVADRLVDKDVAVHSGGTVAAVVEPVVEDVVEVEAPVPASNRILRKQVARKAGKAKS